jgi:hypothetical protein
MPSSRVLNGAPCAKKFQMAEFWERQSAPDLVGRWDRARGCPNPTGPFYDASYAPIRWTAVECTSAGWKTSRINHPEAYSDLEGSCTNQVESYFARLRRMVRGQHHGVSPRHLHQYANHAAWFEGHRRKPDGTLAERVMGIALSTKVSRQWKGYWQASKA